MRHKIGGGARLAATSVTSIGLLLNGLLFFHWLPRWNSPGQNDFSPFYAAGKLTLSGHVGAVYFRNGLYPTEEALARSHHMAYLPFAYPPDVAGFFALFATLDLHRAYALWTALNIACYLLASILVLRALPVSWRLPAGFALLGCVPMLVSSVQGENSGILALGMTLVLGSLVSDQEGVQLEPDAPPKRIGVSPWTRLRDALPAALAFGSGIALLSIKPQLLMVPLIAVVVRRKAPEVLGSLAALALAVTSSIAVGGAGGVFGFLSQVRRAGHWTTQYDWGASQNYDGLAQAQRFLGYGWASTIIWAMAVIAVAFTVIWLVRVNRISALALAGSMILVANHLPFHDLVLLVIALALALPNLPRPAMVTLCIPWLEPVLYPTTGIHPAVVICVGLLALNVWTSLRVQAGTMSRHNWIRSQGGLWRLFAPPRWGSASGSGTRSTS